MSTASLQEGVTAAYRQRLASFLGDQDPLDVLSRTPALIGAAVRTHGWRRLQVRPIEGRWTPLEVIGHLCDCEWVYGYRARRILCEERPALRAMDQDAWVAGQKYNEREPLELAEEFRALRAHNLRLWRSLGPAQLAREGLHNERGPESLDLLRTLTAGHDLLHLDQMKRLLMAIV